MITKVNIQGHLLDLKNVFEVSLTMFSSRTMSGKNSGIGHLRSGSLYKGLAFGLDERQSLGIHGLLPPRVKSQEEQMANVLKWIRRYSNSLDKYVYLNDLQVRNEKLFYRVLNENLPELMPIVYAPTFGLGCLNYGLAFCRPKGLFLTLNDRGHIQTILNNWPDKDKVKAVIVTDGGRILGLGDLGSHGMGVPVGKGTLYTALAKIDPSHWIPVCLDVGINNPDLLKDSDYMGIRKERVVGADYDSFLEEFVQAVVVKFGPDCLIHFEDFGNENAFRLLAKYRDSHTAFNNDIQGTGAVAMAGILACIRLTKDKPNLSNHKFLFQGAGEANIGIATMIVRCMEIRAGIPRDQAIKRIYMRDSKGLVLSNRKGLNPHKLVFARDDQDDMFELKDIIDKVRPSVLIGAAAVGGAFDEPIIRFMAKINKVGVHCFGLLSVVWREGHPLFSCPIPSNGSQWQKVSPWPGQQCLCLPWDCFGDLTSWDQECVR